MANYQENLKINVLPELLENENKYLGYIQGIGLTLILTVLSQKIVNIPFLNVMGTMVIAILMGIAWRNVMGIPQQSSIGIDYASKKLLRLGIILMGVRLNIVALIQAGPKVLLLDAIVITFTISFIYWLGRKWGVGKNLAMLTAVGTGVCGAAAIAAIAPTINAKEDETAVSVATIAILGTFWTIFYTLSLNFFNLGDHFYGVLAGSTLHEVAHVIAASQPGGEIAADIAILTKLGRVALLVPVTFVISMFFNKTSNDGKQLSISSLPIPWFIFGFLGVGIINSLGIFPPNATNFILQTSIFLLTMAMAGLGLNVDLATFKNMGKKSFKIGFIGSIALTILGFTLIILLNV